jgi:hypothetical protein
MYFYFWHLSIHIRLRKALVALIPYFMVAKAVGDQKVTVYFHCFLFLIAFLIHFGSQFLAGIQKGSTIAYFPNCHFVIMQNKDNDLCTCIF